MSSSRSCSTGRSRSTSRGRLGGRSRPPPSVVRPSTLANSLSSARRALAASSGNSVSRIVPARPAPSRTVLDRRPGRRRSRRWRPPRADLQRCSPSAPARHLAEVTRIDVHDRRQLEERRRGTQVEVVGGILHDTLLVLGVAACHVFRRAVRCGAAELQRAEQGAVVSSHAYRQEIGAPAA